MSFNVIRKEKAIDILLALRNGAKGVREIQEAVGGSYTTLNDRIKEELFEELIIEEILTGNEFGEIPRNKRLLKLTNKGKTIVDSFVDSGFIKPLTLAKDRQKCILYILELLGNVRGRTRLMKLLFLLRFELGLKRGSFFKFKAWLYGPFSSQIVDDLRELETQRIISKKTITLRMQQNREENNLYEYALTDEGKTITSDLLKELSTSEIEVIRKLKTFYEMPLENLVRYVYQRYPNYITESIITERILGNSSGL